MFIMKLTNTWGRAAVEESSSDLSRYFLSDDRQQLYNYSNSYNNETLLLETTQIPNKRTTHPHPTSLSSHPTLAKDHSLLEQLYEQLEISVSQHNDEDFGKRSGELYSICRNLVGTLRQLETKFDRLEGREREKKSGNNSQKDSMWGDSEKEGQSILTYSSLKTSQGCKCEPSSKELMQNLLEFIEYKSKAELYRQENEELRRQVVQLQVNNEETKRGLKRLEGENSKLKELLRQYQLFNKKQPTDRKIPTLENEERAKGVFSDRKFHTKSNSQLPLAATREEEEYPECHHNLRSYQDKENINEYYDRSPIEEPHKFSPVSPSLTLLKQFCPQNGRQKEKSEGSRRQNCSFKQEAEERTKPKERKITQIFSFEQCKHSGNRNQPENHKNQHREYHLCDDRQQYYKLLERRGSAQLLDYVQALPSLQQNPQTFCQLKKTTQSKTNRSLYSPPRSVSPHFQPRQ